MIPLSKIDHISIKGYDFALDEIDEIRILGRGIMIKKGNDDCFFFSGVAGEILEFEIKK